MYYKNIVMIIVLNVFCVISSADIVLFFITGAYPGLKLITTRRNLAMVMMMIMRMMVLHCRISII